MGSLSVLDFLQFFGVRFGQSYSSCKFLRLFRFAVFMQSSCAVVVTYFMFIPMFVVS